MNNNPLVSIIVPVFNTEQYLKRCLDSLINQSYNNIEIILIDDGSTDGSPGICDYFASIDDRVKVVHVKNCGVSSARNIGLDAAKGDWIFFCDSDDWISLDAIKVCSDFFKTNDIIRFSAIHHFKKKPIIKLAPNIVSQKDFLRSLISRSVGLGVCGGIYNAKLFSTGVVIRFDPSLYMGEDWVVLTRLCIRSHNPIGIGDTLYNYNRLSESSCVNRISFEKWYNCFQAFVQIKGFITIESEDDYKFEFNTSKVKIFFECIKNSAIIYTSRRSNYKSLLSSGCIPTIEDIKTSKVSWNIKLISFVARHYLGFILFALFYKLYYSLKS